jgi:hypothetical protein
MDMVASGLGRSARASAAILLTLGMSLNAAAAQGRRGATVRVDMRDGARVQGELVVVGGASLLIRDRAGVETSYGVDDMVGVTVSRHKKKFPAGIVGFAVGASVGYAVGANPHNWPHGEDTLVLRGIGTGLLWGILGAVVGTAVSAGQDRDIQFFVPLQGTIDQVKGSLTELKKYTRVRD